MWLSDEEYREIRRTKFHRMLFQTSVASLLWVAALNTCPKLDLLFLVFALYRILTAVHLLPYPRQLAIHLKHFKDSVALFPYPFALMTETFATLRYLRTGEFFAASSRCPSKDTLSLCWLEGGNLERRHNELLEEHRISKNAYAAAQLGHILLLKGDSLSCLAYSQEAIQHTDRNSRHARLKALLNSARAHTRLNELAVGDQILSDLATELRHDGSRFVDSGEIELALAELRLKQRRLEEAELHSRNAFEYYRGKDGEGSPIRVYAERLLALVLQHRGRETESMELLFAADFSEQLMIASNEHQADLCRSAMQSRSELTFPKPRRRIVTADSTTQIIRIKADTPTWCVELMFPFFVSPRTASLLSRAGLLRHWRLHSMLRCGLVALMTCWALSKGWSYHLTILFIVIQSFGAWQTPNFFLACYVHWLEDRSTQLKKV
ncbi:MAG: hypothetical protein K2W95_33115 [Candidatus Obscuribacterales bacterium]|nr:hypothetical protein [Candidatus Obscuribacterales bacterium]